MDSTRKVDIVGVEALSRDSFLSSVTENGIAGAPFLEVRMPCGTRSSYQTRDDIPSESVPCPCGDASHWVIRYGRGVEQ